MYYSLFSPLKNLFTTCELLKTVEMCNAESCNIDQIKQFKNNYKDAQAEKLKLLVRHMGIVNFITIMNTNQNLNYYELPKELVRASAKTISRFEYLRILSYIHRSVKMTNCF